MKPYHNTLILVIKDKFSSAAALIHVPVGAKMKRHNDVSKRLIFYLYSPYNISLQVVSTKVGGVPEVLPPSLIKLAQPSSESFYF